MTTIESKKAKINKPREEVFSFLSDLNNFGSLLPEDRISNFESTETSCSFSIKGMADIDLEKTEEEKPGRIKLKSGSKAPFKFDLSLLIEEGEESQTTTYLKFEGDINPFMKMMVEKPLTNFFNMLAEKLEEIHAK